MEKGIYKRNLLVPFLKLLIDVLMIEAAVLLSYYLRFYSPLTNWFPVANDYYPPLSGYLWFSLIIVGIFVFLFSSARAYRSRFFSTFSQDLPLIFRTCFIGLLLAMSAAFMYRGFSYSRLVFLLIYLNSNVLLLIGRFVFHQLRKMFLKRGFNVWRLYLVGSPEMLPQIYRQMMVHHEMNFELAGYLADEAIDEIQLPRIGSLADVDEIIGGGDIDGLLIAFHQSDNARMMEIMKTSEGKNVELFYIADILNVITSNVNHLEISGIPVLQLKAFTISGWQGFIKRGFDIIVSSIALVVLAPLFLLLATLIKLNSKGPVFYKQQRVSMNDSDFMMIKFRSMVVSEESKSGLVDVVRNDPRVTAIGKFLRRTSLDELPQLYNVLKGEMSLVGPRPERRYYVDENAQVIPRYSDRHRVRCGITGWAQVSGLRQQDTSLEKRIQYDLFYIENWSLWFDLKIILMTFIEVTRGADAY